MKIKTVLVVLLIIGVGAVFYFQNNAKPENPKPSSVPKKKADSKQTRVDAIDLSFQDLEGNTHKLSDFKGKVIILNMRARGCSACQYESQFLEKLYSQIKSNADIQLVPIFEGESRDVIARYIKTEGINYPVYVDQSELSLYKYRVNAFPTSFIIDKEFRVVTMTIGALDWSSDEVVKFLNQLGNE